MRLIDADALKRKLSNNLDDVLWEIYHAPTVDAVEVVRCKDCRHTNARGHGVGIEGTVHCEVFGLWLKEDFFCYCGDKKC